MYSVCWLIDRLENAGDDKKKKEKKNNYGDGGLSFKHKQMQYLS